MRKVLLPVIAAFIVAAFYIISGAHSSPSGAPKYFGAADDLGSDDDANARINYELMQLRDPATGRIPDHMREKELAFAATLPNDAYVSSAGRATAAGGTRCTQRIGVAVLRFARHANRLHRLYG